ncbi:MAG: aldolase [Planctomycetes bacterium]|nr:aldolase [Planctomycetota bacterium]
MNPTQALWQTLKQNRLIALLAPPDAESCVRAYEALHPLGVVLEVTLRTDAAHAGLAAVRARYPDALLLAGTVTTAAQVDRALAAGASGIVSADFFPEVVRACVLKDVMCIPGGLSDVGKQLVLKAELYGCTLAELREQHSHQWIYKLFPAVAGLPTMLEVVPAWKAVYPDLTIVYTGGVAAHHIPEITRRDANSIICGSALTRACDDPEAMASEARRWLAAIHAAQPGPVSIDKTAAPTSGGRTVVTFGEIMLRLAPPAGRRLSQVANLDATFGGAEANVAVALVQCGSAARFCTAVPDNPLGQAVVNTLRGFGVDTTHVLRQGRRLGVYYLEHGVAQRPSQVIYDRAGSAVSELAPGQIDWDAVFADAGWFHWTGITPALSDSAAAVTREALEAARRAGLTVSVDLNYRATLWTPARAREVLTPLMEYVDIAIGNEEDAAQVFGIRAARTNVAAGQLDIDAYRDVAEQLIARCGLRLAAITLRESLSASDNRWSACLHDGQQFCHSKTYAIHVLDRVGSGDAFAAGLIHELNAGKAAPDALEFAVAAACLKHSLHGDFNLVSRAEIEAIAGGDVSGRVRR